MSNFRKTELKGYETWVSKDWGVAIIKVPASTEGDFYDVTVFSEDNSIECACKGWEFRKSCKHLLLVRSLLGQ